MKKKHQYITLVVYTVLQCIRYNTAMVKEQHASIRLEKELYEPLQIEAEKRYEGNLSLLIRIVLRDYVQTQLSNNEDN